jgi:hypothetical protein
VVNVREYVPVKVWPEQSQARLWPLPSWKVTVSPTAIVKLDGEKESPEVPTWYPVVDGTVVVVVTGTRVVVVETAVGAAVVGLSTTVVDTAGAKVSPADRSAVSEAVPPHATRASRDTPIRIRTDFIVLPLPWAPKRKTVPLTFEFTRR